MPVRLGPGRAANRRQNGRLGDPSLPFGCCDPPLFVRCTARYRTSHRRQCSRSKTGLVGKGKPRRHLSDFDFEVWVGRSPWEFWNAARGIRNRRQNWRRRAGWHCFQGQASHWRNRRGRCARARSDRHADYLVAWQRGAQRERIPARHLYTWHTGRTKSRTACQLRLHPHALRRHH